MVSVTFLLPLHDLVQFYMTYVYIYKPNIDGDSVNQNLKISELYRTTFVFYVQKVSLFNNKETNDTQKKKMKNLPISYRPEYLIYFITIGPFYIP